MTPIAPHMSAFLRERLPLQRGASDHTCDSYAYAFQLLFQFASARLQMTPSALALEQLDAPLIMEFLHYLKLRATTAPARAMLDWSPLSHSCAFSSIACLRCWNTVGVFSPSQPRKPRPGWCIISRSRRCKAS